MIIEHGSPSSLRGVTSIMTVGDDDLLAQAKPFLVGLSPKGQRAVKYGLVGLGAALLLDMRRRWLAALLAAAYGYSQD